MNKANLLIPMAGAGTRFQQKGYLNPKPFIKVFDKPMIEWVISNFDPFFINKYIFICRKEHNEFCNLFSYFAKITKKPTEVVEIDYTTEGAACTTLLAEKLYDDDTPLLLANSDQYVDWDFKNFYSRCQQYDGCILTFRSNHPKWSYVKIENNLAVQIAEKKVISEFATTGIYYWNSGKNYIKYAKQMIDKNLRVNNEFYVCPVYNESIENGDKIAIYNIDVNKMWGLGTPEDLEYFLNNFKVVK